jgi:hypothetical protein
MAAMSFSRSCIDLGRILKRKDGLNKLKIAPFQLGATRKSVDLLSEAVVLDFSFPFHLGMLQKGFELFDLTLKRTAFILCIMGTIGLSKSTWKIAQCTHLFAVSLGSTPQPVVPRPHRPSQLSSAED